MTDRAHTVREVAERYAVTGHTVLRWINSGELRAINVGRLPGSKKPRWRVTQEALEVFEIGRMPSPPTPRTRRRRAADNDVVEFYK